MLRNWMFLGLCWAMPVLAQTQVQEYPAGYEVATQRLHIPCAEVSSLPGVYQVELALESASPMTFRVTQAVSIQPLVACKSATFDTKTGVLTIPKVELTNSLGSYAATLQQTTPDQLTFTVTQLREL